ncbi:MAG: hypothetical protein JXA66_04185 [Oligoflexia bacterium]|nr:hypothetical protein [Oligoflexia bacterium]
MVKKLSLLLWALIIVPNTPLYAKKRPLKIYPEPENANWAMYWYKGVFDESFSRDIYFMYLDKFNYSDTTTGYFRTKTSGNDYYYGGAQINYAEREAEQRKFAKYVRRRIYDYHINTVLKQHPTLKPLYYLHEKIKNIGKTLELVSLYKSLRPDKEEIPTDNNVRETNREDTQQQTEPPGEKEKLLIEAEKIKNEVYEEPVKRESTKFNSKIDIIKGYMFIGISSWLVNSKLNYDFNDKKWHISISRPVTQTTGISMIILPKTKEVTTTLGKSLGTAASLTTTLHQDFQVHKTSIFQGFTIYF